MKVLSASLFVTLGLAIGTTISAIAAGPGTPAGGPQLAADTAGKDYAHVMEREAIAGLEDTTR